jgi:DNA-binding beta-propeller fold protein YncE
MNDSTSTSTNPIRRARRARPRRLPASIALVALLGAACSGGSDESEGSTDTDAAPTITADAPVTAEPTTTDGAVTTDSPTTTEAPSTTEPPETTATEPPPRPEEPFDVSLATLVGRPADTNSFSGVNVSPVDGNVYAASVGGNEITVHDPETGEILDRIGPERGVNGPDDVFITDDGTVYWTDLLAGNVGMLTPDGEFKKQMVGPGVNPITMSDDGRLFVARIFLGDGLYEIDPMLEADPIPLDETLAGLNAFDFGPDGLLYAPSFFTGEVLRIDVDAAPLAPEVVASGFGVSSAVKFNSLGEAHVVNIAEGQVFKLDLAGGGEPEMLVDIEGTIDNMAFDADDRLFVVAGSDNQIIRIDDEGVTELGELGIGSPGGVAVSPDGTVWLGELFVMRGYDADGVPTTSFYDRTSEPGEGFAGAATVSADGDNLIIANVFSGSVQVIDPATGGIVQDVRTLVLPVNAIRHGDRIVAMQIGGGNVVNIDDAEDVLIGDLALPTGMASDGATLYVADWATGDIWAVDEAGPRVLIAGLAQPEGLAVDGDRLLVVETGLQQVTAVDLTTGETSPVITGLDFSASVIEGFLPFGGISGVAVGPDGAIYVSDDGVNSLYRFER